MAELSSKSGSAIQADPNLSQDLAGTVRLTRAGNDLAEALEARATNDQTIERLVQAWEAALFAAGRSADVAPATSSQLAPTDDTPTFGRKTWHEMRRAGDRLQSESSRLAAWARQQDDGAALPYEIYQAVLAVEVAGEQWTEIRRKEF